MEELIKRIRKFRDDRDWMQFHNPRNLAVSISIEAAELLEHFQWKDNKEAAAYAEAHKEEVSDEMADIAICLFEMADNMGVDLLRAMRRKLRKIAAKYPVAKARGVATKYDKL